MMNKAFVVLGVVTLMLVMPDRAYMNIAGTRRGVPDPHFPYLINAECTAAESLSLGPCLNGGYCIAVANIRHGRIYEPVCKCPIRFWKTHCEKVRLVRRIPCTSEQTRSQGCLNGGLCLYIVNLGKVDCRCSNGYSGERCETATCDKRPVRGRPSDFEQNSNGRWIRMTCAPGTVYSQAICSCTVHANPVSGLARWWWPACIDNWTLNQCRRQCKNWSRLGYCKEGYCKNYKEVKSNCRRSCNVDNCRKRFGF